MKKQKKPVHNKKIAPGQPKPENIKRKEYFTINHKAGILLGLLAFLLYSNTINFGYVLDDSAAIVENRFVQKGLAGISGLLTTDYWQYYNLQLGYYRPLSLISFAVEYQFFKLNPLVSHLVNVLIFAFTAYFLFILLSKIFRKNNFLFPFAISLLFICHPVHTEVVANLKSRDELLSFLNVLLMIWFSLKFQESKKPVQVVFSMFFFYLALLSKETALAGLLLLPVILFFQNNISIISAVKKTIPYLLVLIIFLLQKKMLMGTVSGKVPDDIVNYPYKDLSVKIAMAFLFFAFGLKLLFVPHPLRYDYSYNQIPGAAFSDAAVLAGLILFAAGAFVILKYYKTKSPLILGILIFYITIMPMMAFTVLRGGIFAERFLFFPSLGFSIAFIAALSVLLKTNFIQKVSGIRNLIMPRVTFFVPVFIVAVLFSVKTFSRNYAWKDEITLFSTDIKTGENSVQNLRHYGTEILKLAVKEKDPVKKKEYAAEALRIFKRAVEIHPKFGEIYNQLGVLYQEVYTNLDSSIYYFNMAAKTAPLLPFPVYNLGTAYQLKGMNNVASFYYNEALKVNPYYQDAIKARDNLKNNLGLDIHVNPLLTNFDSTATKKDGMYYYNLGNYYAGRGNYVQAASQFEQSIALDSNMEGSYINLANCYGMLKEYDKSINVSEQLLRKNPNNLQALDNLAITYKSAGNNEKAEEYSKKANALRNR